MSSFDKAINPLLKREGAYANVPGDRGGETYKGISRRFWPQWSGWKTVDAAKRSSKSWSQLSAELELDAQLQMLVKAFYKLNFWNVLALDDEESQAVAEKVFDIAVNQGIERARKFYEEARRV